MNSNADKVWKIGDELNMANNEGHHEIASDGSITLQALEAAAGALQRRGDIRNGGIKIWLGEAIEHWYKSISTQQGGEFRTDESVLEQHFLASLPKDDWRVPYGMDGPQARELVGEFKWRRKRGQSLDGLTWPPSDDPYAPANDPNHMYYIPKEGES
jgi:hypothetical protein